MAAVHAPCAFYRGDTWDIDGLLFYADGTPFNLHAGAAVQWTLEDAQGNVALALTIGNGGIVVVDAGNGKCLITVTPLQSAAIAAGKYTDQLRATDPTGFVSTQWVGTIEVRSNFFVP